MTLNRRTLLNCIPAGLLSIGLAVVHQSKVTETDLDRALRNGGVLLPDGRYDWRISNAETPGRCALFRENGSEIKEPIFLLALDNWNQRSFAHKYIQDKDGVYLLDPSGTEIQSEMMVLHGSVSLVQLPTNAVQVSRGSDGQS